MFRDISNWELTGYGGKSTLEKEELVSPDGKEYIIKYPRQSDIGTSWEDITELIAAEIGNILGLQMMKVELVIRNGRRGCLLRNFVKENLADMNSEGGSLLSNQLEYLELQNSTLKQKELISAGFEVLQGFEYWKLLKLDFINMLVFDILIGNQDRQPFNWMLLFYRNGNINFSPIYDNGASLGWRFTDEKLLQMMNNRIV